MWRARRWACPVTLANLRKLFITSAITTKTRPHPSHPQRQGASARRAPEDDDENTIVCQTVCIALSPVAHHTESSYNKCTESQQVLTTLLTLLNNVVRTCDHHHADNHDHWLHSGCTPRPSRARPRTTAVSGTRSPTRPRPRAGRRPCRQTHNRHIRGQTDRWPRAHACPRASSVCSHSRPLPCAVFSGRERGRRPSYVRRSSVRVSRQRAATLHAFFEGDDIRWR